MSNYSKYLKSRKEKSLKWFLEQEPQRESNKYIKFNHVLDDDNIIICTNDITFYNSKNSYEPSYMLMVDNNKAVFLKNWQVRICKCRYTEEFYAVKLNRKYFKVYTFKNEFENMIFEKEQTFDDLKELAILQNDTAYHISE